MSTEKVTPDNLNSVMEFEHVITVHPDGTVTDSPNQYPYFDLHVIESTPGTWVDEFTIEAGWQLLTGYTGQYGYNGPVMHVSEYIGGRMARDILETPGDYVALTVESLDMHEWEVSTFTGTKTCARCGLFPLDEDDMDSMCNGEPAGWAVAFKPLEDS